MLIAIIILLIFTILLIIFTNGGLFSIQKKLEEVLYFNEFVLNECPDKFNAFVHHTMSHNDFNSVAIQYCLVFIRKTMQDRLDEYIENEDYEDANECKKYLAQIDQLLRHDFTNKNPNSNDN